MFNIGDVAATCVNSYSLDKVASLGDMLATGDWHKQTDLQFKVWLSKAIDSENETDMQEWCAMFNGGKWAIDGKEIAKSPTQRNQCDTMAERLGMIKRIKSSGHSFTSWEKVDHKIWSKLDEIFDAHLVTE